VLLIAKGASRVIEKIIEYCNEKIADCQEEIKEIKKGGHRNSYGHGYEVGYTTALHELIEFIKEQAE
jgi:hypothetical protein